MTFFGNMQRYYHCVFDVPFGYEVNFSTHKYEHLVS